MASNIATAKGGADKYKHVYTADKFSSSNSFGGAYCLFFCIETEETNRASLIFLLEAGEADGTSLLEALIMKRTVSSSIAPTNPRMPPAAL